MNNLQWVTGQLTLPKKAISSFPHFYNILALWFCEQCTRKTFRCLLLIQRLFLFTQQNKPKSRELKKNHLNNGNHSPSVRELVRVTILLPISCPARPMLLYSSSERVSISSSHFTQHCSPEARRERLCLCPKKKQIPTSNQRSISNCITRTNDELLNRQCNEQVDFGFGASFC